MIVVVGEGFSVCRVLDLAADLICVENEGSIEFMIDMKLWFCVSAAEDSSKRLQSGL